MNVILGKDVVIQFFKNDEYQNFVCAENVTFRGQTETKSVKTIGDGIWSTYRLQKNGYTLDITGIIPYDEPDYMGAFDLVEYWKQGVGIKYQMIFNDQTGSVVTAIYGTALVTSCEVSGPVDFAGASFTLQGIGEPVIGVPPTCTKAIRTNPAGYTIVKQGLTPIYRVTINTMADLSALSFVPQWQWRVDGGAMNVEFSTTWLINFAAVDPTNVYGTHTVEIWPVCDNGARGEKLTRKITVPFG